MYSLFATFQFYFEKTKWVAIGSCIGAILNVILNAIFIPLYGFVAAGYTTLVCYILFGVFHYYFMLKVCDEFLDGNRVYNATIIFGIGGFLMVLCITSISLYGMPIIRYVIICVILLGGIIKRKKLLDLYHSISAKQ